MKLVIGLVAAYAALALVAGNLDAVASAACRADVTLPDLACRFGSIGITLVAVPFCGVIAMVATWAAMSKKQRS